MSTYTYQEECKELRKQLRELMRKMLDNPGVPSTHEQLVEYSGLEIQYYDRMYDYYDSLGNTKEANRHRKLMEECIRKRKTILGVE